MQNESSRHFWFKVFDISVASVNLSGLYQTKVAQQNTIRISTICLAFFSFFFCPRFQWIFHNEMSEKFFGHCSGRMGVIHWKNNYSMGFIMKITISNTQIIAAKSDILHIHKIMVHNMYCGIFCVCWNDNNSKAQIEFHFYLKYA